jgi:uncharacterized protein
LADLTPSIPAGRQLIQAYGNGTFRVSGRAYQGSVLVFPDETRAWPIGSVAAIDPDALGPVLARQGSLDLLLLGAGPVLVRPAPEIARSLRAAGIALEVMDTGAACRTYNVLLAEDRRVAAALIAL